jgi:hypothetical protein
MHRYIILDLRGYGDFQPKPETELMPTLHETAGKPIWNIRYFELGSF